MLTENLIKKIVKHSVPLMRLYRWCRKQYKYYRYPNWNTILETERMLWQDALKSSREGPKILLATGHGSHMNGTIFESILAVALTLRRADVHLLYCDSFLPACLMCEVGLMKPKDIACYGPTKYFCKNCFAPANSIYKSMGLAIHKYSEFITEQDLAKAEEISSKVSLAEISQYLLDGIAIGEHAIAGALRYFATSSIENQAWSEQVLRRYLKSSILTGYVMKNFFKTYKINCVVCLHGIYVPHGIICEIARNEKVRVVNWSLAYRKRTVIFSHHDTYHHTLMSEPTDKWENLNLTPQLESDIMDYLISRQRGGRDWITFSSKNPDEDLSIIAKKIGGIDFSKHCIGMLTNVAWDAQLHYPANAFPNMKDWVLKTIKYFVNRPDLQLVIRVHPAEISGDIPSRQPIMKEIQKAFPGLPKNVFIIKPKSRISTYKVMEKCNAVIIYGTKTGVELTSRGIPVIVAGEAWIRNKGLTIDAKSEEDYFKVLDRLPFPEGMTKEQIERALKYAFHFFFRRMILISQIEPTGGEPRYQIKVSSVRDFLPSSGGPGLDIICDGILSGSDFIYPAEKFFEDFE